MKKIQNLEITSIPLLSSYLEKHKNVFTKDRVLQDIGRFLTFRELQFLHKNHGISDAELGFYMDMKAQNSFTENQFKKIQEIHANLK